MSCVPACTSALPSGRISRERAGLRAVRRIGRRRHAPADEPVCRRASSAAWHCAGSSRSARRPRDSTREDALLENGLSFDRIGFGIVAKPKLDRIDAERDRELVHRDFERERAGRFARRALKRRRADVELDEPVRRIAVRARVEHARRRGRRFDPVFEHRRRRNDVMTDRGQLAVVGRAERDVLLGVRPMADRREHLAAVEHELDRPTELARRHRGQHDMRPDRTLAAEAAADERRDHVHVFDGMPNRLRERLAAAEHALRRVVDGQPIALPLRRGSRAAPSDCDSRRASCRCRRFSPSRSRSPMRCCPSACRSSRDSRLRADTRSALAEVKSSTAGFAP